MYKKIILFIYSLSFSYLHTQESSQVIVGTNAEFPPFSYMENHTLVGFDIDVAQEVAKKLGKTIQWKDMPFDALIPDIMLGHVDFVAAGMSYTDERAKRVSFTKSYLSEDPLVIFTSSKSPLSFEQIEGKTVIVIEGFTADLFMSSKKGVNLIRLPTQADGFIAIKSGRADAFVTAKSTVDSFFKVQDPSSFHFSVLDQTGETCALVVPKCKPEMLKNIQKALDELENEGTMTQLKAKWRLL